MKKLIVLLSFISIVFTSNHAGFLDHLHSIQDSAYRIIEPYIRNPKLRSYYTVHYPTKDAYHQLKMNPMAIPSRVDNRNIDLINQDIYGHRIAHINEKIAVRKEVLEEEGVVENMGTIYGDIYNRELIHHSYGCPELKIPTAIEMANDPLLAQRFKQHTLHDHLRDCKYFTGSDYREVMYHVDQFSERSKKYSKK